MQLNRKICKRGMAVMVLLVMLIFILLKTKNKNIVLYMQDGFEDSDIVQYFKQDIEDVEALTNGSIRIKYYDFDINDDGFTDKIVYIASPLHSGAHGDSLRILVYNGESYEEVLSMTALLWEQYREKGFEVTEMGELYIMPEKTNGFYDIKVKGFRFDNELILKYKDGFYQ